MKIGLVQIVWFTFARNRYFIEDIFFIVNTYLRLFLSVFVRLVLW